MLCPYFLKVRSFGETRDAAYSYELRLPCLLQTLVVRAFHPSLQTLFDQIFESLYELDLPAAIAQAHKFAKSGPAARRARKAEAGQGGGGVGQPAPAIGLKVGVIQFHIAAQCGPNSVILLML